MEKTTIYLSEEIKEHLLDLAAKMSKRERKRVTMTDIIREALKEYMRKRGVRIDNRKEITKRMLSTRGALDSEDFEKRVREVKESFSGWKIRSA
jgi:predicted transcriptional regulator